MRLSCSHFRRLSPTQQVSLYLSWTLLSRKIQSSERHIKKLSHFQSPQASAKTITRQSTWIIWS